MTKFECQQETLKHINIVRKFMNVISKRINKRALTHDQSKLQSPEVDIFAEYTPKLATTTYGSDEYKQYLNEMKIALNHHYAVSPHHPEYSDYILKEWKEIEEFNGKYLISNNGEVKTSDGTIIMPFESPSGYLVVQLDDKTFLIHELVCKSFNTSKKNSKSVLHKDYNKHNNNASNLEYSSLDNDYCICCDHYLYVCPELNIISLDANDIAKQVCKLGYDISTADIENYVHGTNSEYHGVHFMGYRIENYHESKLSKMDLVDLIEMICDWNAATMRHNDGDIYKSIDINQKRFGYSDEIKQILLNTIELLKDGNI